MAHKQRHTKVHETGLGKYQNQIEIGPHLLLASEPVELGGDDTGPTPIELLNAALGACTTITLRMYADRKGWPVKNLSVEVTHKRGQLEECQENGGANSAKMQDIFSKKIIIEGDLTDAQRSRLIEIAKKCPVHRALGQQSCMRSELVD